jgi:hypothetical protein
MADVTSPFGFPYPEDTDLVRDGASDIENLAEGVNDYLEGGFLFAGQRRYESSGTFLKADPLGTGDIGLRAIRVRLVGGGASGGGCEATTGSQICAADGGGGGGYAESFLLASTLSATETVTRGSGGNAAAAGNNNGNAGGVSSFGSAVSADGGVAGRGAAAGDQTFRPNISNGSAAGVGTAGDILARGNDGGSGMSVGNRAKGGYGGGTVLTGNTRPQWWDDAAGNGDVPLNLGAGSAGASQRISQSARGSRAGGNGIVIVDVFV